MILVPFLPTVLNVCHGQLNRKELFQKFRLWQEWEPWKLPLSFVFHPVQYKLLNYVDFKPVTVSGPVSDCREGCEQYGLAFMPMDSPNYLKNILHQPNYIINREKLILTAGVERYSNSTSSLYSSPGGGQVNFVSLTGTLNQQTPRLSGNFCVAIYYGLLLLRPMCSHKLWCLCLQGQR